MKTKKNFSPIVSHYKSFFADTFLKFISIRIKGAINNLIVWENSFQ